MVKNDDQFISSQYKYKIDQMYSILKTQKKKLCHKKYSPITTSLFLTNNHVLFTFADKSFIVFSLRLTSSVIQENQSQLIVGEGHLDEVIIHSGKLKAGVCILIGKNCRQIYEVTLSPDLNIYTKTLEKGLFPQMISGGQNQGVEMLSNMGCQIRLHTFRNSCFIVQFQIYDDHKIVFDCYQPINDSQKKYEMLTIEVDLQITGNYITENCNKQKGQIAVYKQEQISEANWEIKIYKPFANTQIKQQKIILPGDKFTEDVSIMQFINWSGERYLIVTAKLQTIQLQAYVASLVEGNYFIEKLANFTFFTDNLNFTNIFHVDPNNQIFYALTHIHQRIDGELYENGLIIGSMKTGNSIEKGYLSYKNIDLSQDFRYILDVPNQFESYGEIFYHIRLLLSKSSLYMFLIEKSFMQEFSASFKEAIVGML